MHGIEELNDKGFLKDFLLPAEHVKNLVETANWNDLFNYAQGLCISGGKIFNKLNALRNISSVDFIISLREEGQNEDGIWHDDGSRLIAFSWSLTLSEFSPIGGVLSLRKNGQSQCQQFLTPSYGEMIIFNTGEQGWQHQISAVTKGKRLVIAGWGEK